MLLLMILLLSVKTTCITSSNAGSTLFYRRYAGECWSEEDLAKLRVRRIFEDLIPSQVTPDKVNSKYIKETIKYFRRALRSVDKDVDVQGAAILKEALADTIGAHLKSEILPNVRFAYYAGYVPYRNVRQLHRFYDDMKTMLNTQGLGWKTPARAIQQSNLTVAKILVGAGKLCDPCACLIMKRDSNSCIHLPPPKVDDNDDPSAITLPFKTGGLISLASPNSENILLKYYTTASRCILRSSPITCRHSDFVNFNNELWHWMKRDVAPHLMEDKLYTAYGGVLRIAAAVQNYGKGLSRRNLFEDDDFKYEETKWHLWDSFGNTYLYLNADFSPGWYVLLVGLVALAICLSQVCYTYFFGGSCRCAGHSSSARSKDLVYTNVDSNLPAVLPEHRSSERSTPRQSLPKTRSASVGTIRPQRVYDLNDNTEKMMPVIMSDYEGTETESPISTSEQCECDEDLAATTTAVAASIRLQQPSTPPQIETPMSQLRIQKTPDRAPMYSTSTITRSDMTYRQDGRPNDVWSASVSSTDRSVTTSSSKGQSRQSRSRSLRDLAWARRVISKHSVRDDTPKSTGTDFDMNSFTTPPSRR